MADSFADQTKYMIDMMVNATSCACIGCDKVYQLDGSEKVSRYSFACDDSSVVVAAYICDECLIRCTDAESQDTIKIVLPKELLVAALARIDRMRVCTKDDSE